MPTERSTWFCIDIECNGPVPGLYDMVSLGAVAVAQDPEGVLQIGERFYVEIQPQAPRFDPDAAAFHGLDQEQLRRDGLPRRQAALDLAAWVQAETRPDTDPTFVGHNAPFDWSFVAWVYAAEELPSPSPLASWTSTGWTHTRRCSASASACRQRTWSRSTGRTTTPPTRPSS